ncbi:LppM family (lipo)protein [Demequina sp. NBRC 110054]|uniref:LppM family (lipo)protein n=1 Tax=Demequina sp. NBRC 110054 TaxID=1570343 RepID=UPI000A0472C0|nr:hypothetical protein [Demequina sp. NBRC 110054]
MTRHVRRRLGALVLTITAALALSGCYTMSTSTTYHADGTMDMTMIVAMEESLLEDSGMTAEDMVDDTTSEFTDVEGLTDIFTIEPYAEDGLAGIIMTVEGATEEQLAAFETSDSAAYTPASTITYGDGSITVSSLSSEEALAEQEDAAAELEAYGMDISDFAAFLDFEVRHTFPGPVESTTIGYIDPEDPNTVVIDDFEETFGLTDWTIVASDGTSSGIAWWMWAAGGAVLAAILAAGAIVALRSRGTGSDPDMEDVPVAPAPVAAPVAAGPDAATFEPAPEAPQEQEPPQA